MKTSRLFLGSSGAQGRSGPPSSVICTAWITKRSFMPRTCRIPFVPEEILTLHTKQNRQPAGDGIAVKRGVLLEADRAYVVLVSVSQRASTFRHWPQCLAS